MQDADQAQTLWLALNAVFFQANKPAKKATGKVVATMDLDANLDKENFTSDGPAPSKGNKKTVEETYQKLTQLEHVLLRPDTYIGSTELNRTKVCHQSRNVLSLFT